jgi:heterodisulfide reductase subunit C
MSAKGGRPAASAAGRPASIMMSQLESPPSDSVAAAVTSATGVSPTHCYQCGCCAAGCPQNVDGEMDVSPTRIMRLLQLELAFARESHAARQYAGRALTAETPWLCAGCQACTTRCPQNLDIAGTMDVLRQESLRRGLVSRSRRVRDIVALHRTFLSGVMRGGRIHELFLVLGFKLRTGHLLADAALGPAMWRKGKLHLLPGPLPGAERVRAAVQRMKHVFASPRGG